jgi:glycosyltransferase involved in cell wall biosynthesis
MGYQSHRDMAFIKAFDGRMWQWGYFTSPSLEPLIRSDDVPTILWAGRLIPLKGVDVLIRAAARLKRAGHRFEMNIIGDGPVKEGLIALCMRNGLKDRVTFHPSVPADEVRARMRASDIYVLPSNGTEGWGAVVNEAMSEGCLAVVCQEAGSARILIRDGVSGLLFREGDDKQLYQLLSHAITDIGWRQKLACEGQRTIGSLWSPSTGAERLVALSSGLLGIGEVPKYKDGPCRQIF